MMIIWRWELFLMEKFKELCHLYTEAMAILAELANIMRLIGQALGLPKPRLPISMSMDFFSDTNETDAPQVEAEPNYGSIL